MITLSLATASLVGAETAVVELTGDTLTDEQVAVLALNCSKAQLTISRIHIADGVTRANRGKKYEDVLKLQTVLNTRASLNRLSVSALVSATSSLQSQLNTFRSAYIRYDEQLSKVVSIDCQKEPRRFYDMLRDARSTRAALSSEIKLMDESVDQFINGLKALRIQLATPSAQTNGGRAAL